MNLGKSICITAGQGAAGKGLADYLRKFNNFFIMTDCRLFPKGSEGFVIPNALEETHFIDELEKIISTSRIDRIFVCSDVELRTLSLYWDNDKFTKFGLPSKEAITVLQDKYLSSNLIRDYGFNIPLIDIEKLRNLRDSIYIEKNRYSYSRPKTIKKFNFLPPHTDDDKLLMEFVNGKEFSVDTYFEPKRNLLKMAIRERLRIVNGVSQEARFIDKIDLEVKLRKFIEEIGVIGFSCTQFIEREGEMYFLETNPRPGGGLRLTLEAGRF